MLAVAFAKLFMAAYPVLLLDQTAMKAGQQPAQWSAAMTYKFVGVLQQPDRRQAVPAHGDLDRRWHRALLIELSARSGRARRWQS